MSAVVDRASLLVIQGFEQGTRFDVSTADVGIGRGAQNEICLHDTEVSRKHARLFFKDGQFHLRDERSANGTYVNGQAITLEELEHGDQIQVGRTVLHFEREAAPVPRDSMAALVDFTSQPGAHDHSHIVARAAVTEAESLLSMSAISPKGPAPSAVMANLQVLYRIAEEVVRPSQSLDQLLDRILELSLEATQADRGCVLLRDADSGELVAHSVRAGGSTAPRDALGAATEAPRTVTVGSRMPVSRTIVDYVVAAREGVRTTDARADARFVPGQSILQSGIREAICVPLQGRYELLGVIYLDTFTEASEVVLAGRPTAQFTEEALRLMVAIGRQAAIAVEDNRYEQALLKSERLAAVGQTIAILSHHIKNILQGVRGGSYLIDMGLKGHNEDLVRKGWNIVEKNQDKIYHLVMDMLTFGKERKPALRRGTLTKTVDDVVELLQRRAEEIGVELVAVTASYIPETVFDPEGIHRAVLNVLGNALDAVEGREQARVEVESGFDSATGSVYVRVKDNGPGIAPELLPKIFNIFESTKGARGTGIGLAVSQKILREHGGDIRVTSPPHQGATFTLAWPFLDEEPQGRAT